MTRQLAAAGMIIKRDGRVVLTVLVPIKVMKESQR